MAKRDEVIGHKVHPHTIALAPYGYHWVWNITLADWILTSAPGEWNGEIDENENTRNN